MYNLLLFCIIYSAFLSRWFFLLVWTAVLVWVCTDWGFWGWAGGEVPSSTPPLLPLGVHFGFLLMAGFDHWGAGRWSPAPAASHHMFLGSGLVSVSCMHVTTPHHVVVAGTAVVARRTSSLSREAEEATWEATSLVFVITKWPVAAKDGVSHAPEAIHVIYWGRV